MTEDQRWYKEPAPGQFRGDGNWVIYKGSEEDWTFLVETGFLPTHVGPKPPEDTEPC